MSGFPDWSGLGGTVANEYPTGSTCTSPSHCGFGPVADGGVLAFVEDTAVVGAEGVGEKDDGSGADGEDDADRRDSGQAGPP